MKQSLNPDRRQALKWLGAGMASVSLFPEHLFGDNAPMTMKPILSSGEKIPVVGMGTWQTFNVGRDRKLRLDRTEVLKAFFQAGGGMIDCSPMYGSAGEVLGFALEQIGVPDSLFSAEKVWTGDGDRTRQQIRTSEKSWGVQPFDLMQIHNLVAWEPHLRTLRKMKADGEIRYIGITTSHGRRHRDLERLIQNEDLDFVQLTYNLTHRSVENRLLPAALAQGVSVIVNRPYDGGHLIKGLQRRHRLPEWAKAELDCRTWADFLIKFLVSHPAVTCAIPATSKVEHMRENMQAGQGKMPDAKQRQRMIQTVESLL